MAILRNSLLGILRGCVGGARFSHSSAGTVISSVCKKSVAHSQKQKDCSRAFSKGSELWKSLSTAEKKIWTASASRNKNNYSGYQLFLKNYLQQNNEPVPMNEIFISKVSLTFDQVRNCWNIPFPVSFDVDFNKFFIPIGTYFDFKIGDTEGMIVLAKYARPHWEDLCINAYYPTRQNYFSPSFNYLPDINELNSLFLTCTEEYDVSNIQPENWKCDIYLLGFYYNS